MSKVSSGKPKSGPPAHKNSVAWKPDPRSGLAQRIAQIAVSGLCRRCSEIVEFKKKVGQYKPLKDKKKCITCGQKQVSQAYHVICPACATNPSTHQLCGKCREPITDSNQPAEKPAPRNANKPVKEDPKEREQQAELETALRLVPERKRRTVLRKLERGEVDVEEAKAMAERFKRRDEFGFGFLDDDDDDDDDEFGFSDDDDEEEEEESGEEESKGEKQKGNKAKDGKPAVTAAVVIATTKSASAKPQPKAKPAAANNNKPAPKSKLEEESEQDDEDFDSDDDE